MNCQRRWMDYLLRFSFDIIYIKGELNKVADCLSQYYKNDTPQDVHQYDEYVWDEYVWADARIDPTGQDLSPQWFKEVTEHVIKMCAMKAQEEQYSQHIYDISKTSNWHNHLAGHLVHQESSYCLCVLTMSWPFLIKTVKTCPRCTTQNITTE